MDKSIFTDKNDPPGTNDLIEVLGNTYSVWQEIIQYVHLKQPSAIEEWNYPGEKYGWSFRIKDKKRSIVYLLPRNKFFKVAFVFGRIATGMILQSDIRDEIKSALESAREYTEGRGIRIDINNDMILSDIKQLIDIKLSH